MNNFNIFKEIKEYLNPQQVAKYYLQGKGKKSGNNVFYKSPFRNEKTASFCVNNEKGFHDYGDGWHGDIISFVQELYHISPIDAAKTLIQDFALPIEIGQKADYKQIKNQRHKNLLNKKIRDALEKWFNNTFIKLCDENKINEICIATIGKEIKEPDEYKEYNDMLYGTPYVFGYTGLQRKVKKGNSEELKTLSNFLPIPIKKIYIDNGIEAEGYLEIAAVLNNKIKMNPIKVNYNKLENMGWICNPSWDLLPQLRTIFLEANIPLGFVTWLVGESGSQKSSLSSIIVSHFGDFERDTLPGGFKDTVNSIEKKAFTLKDTLFAIDDYYPSQILQEGKKMDAVAESLFGLYGDRQARSRMKQDGQTVKMGFVARGMCIVTGEAFPNMAESRTARALIIEISRGDIDLNLLSEIQKNKEKLSFCMKEYLKYIIDKQSSIKKNCKSKFIEYRDKANQDFAHERIPEIIASEYMGIELFLEFANNKQAITNEEMQKLKLISWNYLIKAAQKQSMKTEENRTDNMFFRGVQELLASKKIYLKSYKNHQKEPDMSFAELVGYYDEERQRCYLFPDVIFNEVVKFYGVQGIKFPGNAGATWKYLKEAGRLFPGEKDRNKTRKTINGKLVTFIEVLAVDVLGEEERVFGDYLSKFPQNTENHSKNISLDEIELPF